jgi:hypothetical protein
MSHVFYTCAVPHHGNCEGWWSDLFNGSHLLVWSLTCFIRVLSVWSHTKDDMLYSRWTCHELWCRHVFSYMCIPHDEYARKGYTPFKWRVSEVGRCPCSDMTHGYRFYSERWCMWTLSWVLAWKVRCILWSSAGTLTTFRKSLSEHRLVFD